MRSLYRNRRVVSALQNVSVCPAPFSTRVGAAQNPRVNGVLDPFPRLRYPLWMADPDEKLTPADPDDLAAALAVEERRAKTLA